MAIAASVSGLRLGGVFEDPLLDVMNFLNEVVQRYPQAVSFAPGRPAEELFDVEGSLGAIPRFVEWRANQRGVDARAVYRELGQYGATNGILKELIAAQLAADEGIRAEPESIVVTCGCQEAMALLLLTLFEPGRDVLLASDPTYIGITGLARILGIEVAPVAIGPEGLELAAVLAAIAKVRAAGGRPRALYDIPDFNNPMGTSMPTAVRRELLDLLREEDVLLFEDNPYGMFAYDAAPAPTIKSLDSAAGVVYLGSFSKTLFPGLRIGYLVADQQVVGPDGSLRPLAGELAKVKSLTTVNTPPLMQAVAGGLLLEAGGSLRDLVGRKLPHYRANRDAMLAALDRELAGTGVTWNRPAGGYFLTLDLSFDFGEAELDFCARTHGVICCPMRFFALAPGRERQVRLSFSYVTPEQVDRGVRAFARFVRERQDP
ncbi:MAG: PLP-dependent aminotransferase family protein [Acidobacteriota bacterium]